MRRRKPRLPSAAEKVHSLLSQAPIHVPDTLVVQLSRMAGPDLLLKIAARSDPIDRSILNRAAALADRQDPPADVTNTTDSDPDGFPAFLLANPVEAQNRSSSPRPLTSGSVLLPWVATPGRAPR